jgi:hypothetical protein
MEQFKVDQRKYGIRSLEAERAAWQGHGDTWQRRHYIGIGAAA